MMWVVDALWSAFCDEGYSWVGFYLPAADAPAVTSVHAIDVDKTEATDVVRADPSQPHVTEPSMELGPRRDKPACSPIGMHGVCGQSFTRGVVRIVTDVALLGQDYIACDPNDRSEIVLPMFDGATVTGVLDIDSRDVDAFDGYDAESLLSLLKRVGLTDRSDVPIEWTSS